MATVRCAVSRWQSFALWTGLILGTGSSGGSAASASGVPVTVARYRVQRRTVLAPHETALDEQFSLRIDDHERARLRHLLCVPHESAAFECDDSGVDPSDFGIK